MSWYISHSIAVIVGGFLVWAYFKLKEIEIKKLSESDSEFIIRKLKLFEQEKSK